MVEIQNFRPGDTNKNQFFLLIVFGIFKIFFVETFTDLSHKLHCKKLHS